MLSVEPFHGIIPPFLLVFIVKIIKLLYNLSQPLTMPQDTGQGAEKRFSSIPFSEFKENISWEPTERITTLSKLLFRAPDPKKTALSILVIGLLMGLIIDLGPGGLIYGFVIFVCPAYAAAYCSMWLIQYYGERFFLRRAMLTSLAGIVIVGIVLVVGTLVQPLLGLGWRFLVIYGYCLDLAMRYLVVRTSCIKHRKFTFLVSSLTMSFVFLFFLPLTIPDTSLLVKNYIPTLEETRFIILSVLSLLGTAFLFTEVVNAPMKNEFGLTATDLLGYFLSYMTSETRELEELFHKMEGEASVPLNTMVFRRKSDSSTKLIALVPGVHPGPMGDLGGSDLPAKMRAALQEKDEAIMCFHGSSTNDLNPVDNSQCRKVADVARRMVGETKEFNDTVSRAAIHRDTSTLSAQLFGKDAFIVHEPTGGVVDDINLSVAVLTETRVKELGTGEVMFADCHNHADKTAGVLDFGHKLSKTIVESAVSVTRDAMKGEQYPFRMGYGEDSSFTKEEGLGAMGIQVMVLELQLEGAASEGGEHYRVAYILCDGNNMLPRFAGEAAKLALELVDHVRVMTTDNHVVNAVIGGYNPIGERTDLGKFLGAVKKALTLALEDLEEAEAGFNSDQVDEVKVIGQGNALRLSTVINNTVALARHALFPFLILAFLSSALAYYLA